MSKFEYKGWEPYGAGDAFIVESCCDGDPWNVPQNATENAIKNGCVFKVLTDRKAILTTPGGATAVYVQKVSRPFVFVTKEYKVYGHPGEEQPFSHQQSFRWDFSDGSDVRIIEVENADKTGTHDYSLVRITRPTEELCDREMIGQYSDGIFENYYTGEIIEEDGGSLIDRWFNNH